MTPEDVKRIGLSIFRDAMDEANEQSDQPMNDDAATADAISILLSARVTTAKHRNAWRILNHAAVYLGASTEYSGSKHGYVAQPNPNDYESHFIVARRYGYPTLW